MQNKLLNLSKYFIFLFLLLIIIFSRSFIGVYIFGFRIGEFIVAFGFLGTFISLLFYRRKLSEEISKNLLNLHLLLILNFIVLVVVNWTSSLDLYIFKSSSYLWHIFYIYFGFYFFKNFKITKKISTYLNYLLILIFYLQAVYFHQLSILYGSYASIYTGDETLTSSNNIILNFFVRYSDKFEPYKGTDLLIFFILILYISNRINRKSVNRFSYFLITSSLFLPLFLVKSRTAAFCAFLFIIYEIYNQRNHLLRSSTYTSFIFVICGLVFFISSAYIVYEPSKTELEDELTAYGNVINELFLGRFVPEGGSFIGINDGRLYSGDGNLNWRLQIWQDVYFDLNDKGKLIQGYGYGEIIPAMDDDLRKGLDGRNENVHNFLINILARGGILQVALYLLFIIELTRLTNKDSLYKVTPVLLPLLLGSLFDSSMENVQFPLFLYLFLGYVINEKKIKI